LSDSIELRHTFDQTAETYEEARPDYPVGLFQDLIDITKIGTESSLLEIGCGSGKATRPLAERGFKVVCVELGPRLAQVARQRLDQFAGVEVITSSFEDWDSGGETFDLIYAATAWHWIDREVRYQKAATLLKPGSHLAFWSATHAFPKGFDPFFTEIQEVYDAIGESHDEPWPPPHPENVPDEAAEIESSGYFEVVGTRRYLWAHRYTAAEYLALLDTFSGHRAMEADKRNFLYREIRSRIEHRTDPRVVRHWLAILHVARIKD
jgi:SAM-dependent methyltransferase